ncbi:MAG: hypothetical protein V1663_02960 [archaeon]
MNRGGKGVRLHLRENPDIGLIRIFLTYGCDLCLGDEWSSTPGDDALFRLDPSNLQKQIYKVSFSNGFIEFRYLGDYSNSDMREVARKLYERYQREFTKVFTKVTNLTNRVIELS